MTVKELRDIVNSIPTTQDKNIVVLSSEIFGYYELDQVDAGNMLPLDGVDKQTLFYDPYANEICFYDPIEFKNYDDFINHVSQYTQLVPCVVLLPLN
jgi:hypothetical protein